MRGGLDETRCVHGRCATVVLVLQTLDLCSESGLLAFLFALHASLFFLRVVDTAHVAGGGRARVSAKETCYYSAEDVHRILQRRGGCRDGELRRRRTVVISTISVLVSLVTWISWPVLNPWIEREALMIALGVERLLLGRRRSVHRSWLVRVALTVFMLLLLIARRTCWSRCPSWHAWVLSIALLHVVTTILAGFLWISIELALAGSVSMAPLGVAGRRSSLIDAVRPFWAQRWHHH